MALTSLPKPSQAISDRQGMITRPWYMAFVQAIKGIGDAVLGPGISVDGEIALFSGTTGKLLKRATGTGVVHATSGVYSASDVTLPEIVPATAASRLIGRRSGSSGDWEEVSLDSTLTMSAAAVLSATTGTGTATSVLGRAANSSGARADIQATTDNQVFARRSSTLVPILEQSIGYWSPLTDTLTPEIIFDSFGDTISVWTAL